MLNGLDLFSGIGGLALALAPWVRPVAYCELDPFARAVLLSRMADGSLPAAPIWDDVRTLRAKECDLPRIDVLYGGFPCQDTSQAGRRRGLDGERSGLYREALRLVDECEPAFAFLENVRGIERYARGIVDDFAQRGFVVRVGTLAASEVGAPHIRDRVWFLSAHPERVKLWLEQGGARSGPVRHSLQSLARSGALDEIMSDYNGERRQARGVARANQWQAWSDGFELCGWTAEPSLDRVAHGIPHRVDRLRGLGNAVVPAQARRAFEILSGIGAAP